MEIERRILDGPAPVSVDRSEVLTWLEQEQTRMRRSSALKLAGNALLLGCLLGLVVHRLEAESQRVKQLVGTHRSTHALMLEQITEELCGEKPAEYWTNQISLIGSRESVTNF